MAWRILASAPASFQFGKHMPVTHAFHSAIADGANATLVRPSDWNAEHVSIPRVIVLQHFPLTGNPLSSMPAALTEYAPAGSPGLVRMFADITNAARARVSVFVSDRVETANATIAIQFSTDGGTSWAYLDGSTGPFVLVGNTQAVSQAYSGAWVTLTAAAKADVLLRAVTQNGNGVDPFRLHFLSVDVD
jgi:hypothetical protein